MKLELTLIEKHLEETVKRLGKENGEKEAAVAEFILRHAMSQLHENATINKLSVKRAINCFVELVLELDQILNELYDQQRHGAKN